MSSLLARAAHLTGAFGIPVAAALLSGCTSIPPRPRTTTELWGFTAPWDPRSAASATAHLAQLQVVVSGFVALDSATFRPVTVFADSLVRSVGGSGSTRYMALITTYQGSRFHPETVRILAQNAVERGRTAGAIATLSSRAGYHGLVLDFEGLTPFDLNGLIVVSREIADSARSHGVAPVAIAIPATDTASYPARPLLAAADLLIVMLYDQHWSTSPPGAIAAPNWAEHALGMRVGEVGPSRLVAALPVYGYRWRSDSATAVVSFADAERVARESYVPLVRDPASATLHAEAAGWSVWVSDATLVDSLVSGARALGVTRFAIWRLGLEDPQVWTSWASRASRP